ncbi:unannotated protein [freshwater metagenome]|uniref:Unannotated protein n=1 Tax=freshwater metagenome TaxID=449393 RepID=A0A6J5ZUK6_9ZZZZ|nr:hypothetical protein [Actinomycetota bacterium]MSW25418.1 hypothetical protein [Actinomycetota bacterium]MSX97772.1 hypothetical protein [Actinomycetota bacterium]MSZ78934.1 hypothetical protein [Actinomycetota bacterium]
MSIGKIFGMIVLTIALMGGCAFVLDGSQQDGAVNAPEVAVTFDPAITAIPTPMASRDYMAACYNMIGQKPGDVQYVLDLGWEIVCQQSGDPMFTGKGDVQTLGYTDPTERVIALDAITVSFDTIAHEAAHVIDLETFDEVSRLKVATKYGAKVWDDADLYWAFPSEMFAESRARCLGFAADDTYSEMSCEDVDFLIDKGSKAKEIRSAQRTLKDLNY